MPKLQMSSHQMDQLYIGMFGQGRWTIEYFPPSGENKSVIRVASVNDVIVFVKTRLPNAVLTINDDETVAEYVDELNTGVALVSVC